jgi:hypothetical protein
MSADAPPEEPPPLTEEELKAQEAARRQREADWKKTGKQVRGPNGNGWGVPVQWSVFGRFFL